MRRGGLVGELVIDVGAHVPREDDDHALYCGYRDGAFASLARGADRNLVPLGDKLADDEQLRDLCPPVTARVGDLTLPWRFLDRGLYKAIIATPTADLLLLDVGKGVYAMIYSFGAIVRAFLSGGGPASRGRGERCLSPSSRPATSMTCRATRRRGPPSIC